MGWTSSPRYYNPTALRRIYATEFNPEKVTVVGWCGGWLKCINKLNDRPFLVCVLVRRVNKNEYAYKDMDSSEGPYYFNINAVKWLKRELAKRNMEPYNQYEADLILRHDRKERQDKYIKSLTRGHELTVIDDFSCTNGAEFMGSLVLMVFLFMVWTVLSVLMFQPTDDSCGLSRLLDCRVKFTYLGRKYDVIYHLDAGWLRSKAVVRQCVLEMVFETHPNAVIESCEII